MEKQRRNRGLLTEIMLVAESLTMFANLCKDIDDDNNAEAEKLDTALLQKLVTQMNVMFEITKESSSTLLELDRRAARK